MIKNKKAILFDLDGTLVESMWMWRDIDILYLQELGEDMPEVLGGSDVVALPNG